MRGGTRGIGSLPRRWMCDVVKTGETIGERMWDVGWASHLRASIGVREWRGGGGLVAVLSPLLDPAGGEAAVAPSIRQIRRENRQRERRRQHALPSTTSNGKEDSHLLLSIGRPQHRRLPAAAMVVVV
uniref:Uncharacterized protein n=1 Tax=Oryza glumipatula TaxID=40148 RepID=A0A0D9Y900_9ORYZ